MKYNIGNAISFQYLSVVDKTRHYYTLCRAEAPIDTPPLPGSPVSVRKQRSDSGGSEQNQLNDDGFEEEHKYLEEDNMFEENDGEQPSETEDNEDAERKSNDTIINTFDDKIETFDEGEQSECIISKVQNKEHDKHDPDTTLIGDEKEKKDDQGITNDSPSGLHYRAGDEPEPIDLTHLNIEAAMMCLASKVRLVSGKADSPSMSSRTFRFKEIDQRTRKDKIKHEELHAESLSTSIGNPNKSSVDNQTEGAVEAPLYNWANELRPSMRKLRQGMDSLCKTARLICR